MGRRKGSKSAAPLSPEQIFDIKYWYGRKRAVGSQKEFAHRSGITEAQIQVVLRQARDKGEL